MTLVDAVMITLHQVFAAVWAGSVVFMTVGVLPLAKEGHLEPEPVEMVTGTLRSVSRASAVVLLLTGGHMAANFYTVADLTGTVNGWLVLAMLGLWLVLIGLIEVSGSRLVDGLQAKKVRAPAHETLGWFRAASVVALLLLVIAGLLSSGALV